MTSVNDYFPSPYVSAKDIVHPVTVTIDRWEEHEFLDKKTGDLRKQPVLFFAGKDKGLVLNKTNAFTIANWWGLQFDSWIGKQLILDTHETNFGPGITVGRVAEPGPPVTKPPAQDGPKPAHDPITDSESIPF